MPNSDKPTEKIKIAQVGRPWPKNFFLVLALFAIVVSIMFFLWYHQKLSVDNSLKSIFSKVSSLEASITRDRAVTSDFRQQLSKSNLLIDRVTSLEKFVNETARLMTKSSDFSGDKWLLMESIYLMRLAKHEAKINRNVEDMVRLLTLIDDIFVELNNPNFLSVRAALAMDIKDLKAMRSNNFEEIFLELSDISEKIFLLESTKSSTYSIAPILEKPTQATLDSKTGWVSLWQKLEGFISIQKYSDSIPPLLDSQQELFVRSALLSFLLQARYALFLEQGTIYRINLLEAADIVDRFFPLKSNAVALSHQLRQLAERPVKRVSLSIERSDNAFAAVIGTEMMDSESLGDQP